MTPRVFILKILALFLCVGLIVPEASFAKRGARKRQISAKSFVVIDSKRGKILYSKNPRLRLMPASTVKVMTALVVLDNISLDKEVAISRRASSMEPSKAYLSSGEYYAVRDLLTACLISSSNDAAVALAEAVAGSEEEFVRLMNKKARRLKMFDTRFRNCTGLPLKGKKQYTTAYDLAMLMKEAAKSDVILSIMAKPIVTIRGSDKKMIRLVNHNKFLFKNNKNILLKTGYTIKSRHCYVGVKIGKRRRYIFALLSSRSPWDDIRYILNKS